MAGNTSDKELVSFRFCSIGSGSKGNGTLVSVGNTLLLIDCGFSIKETVKRLALKQVVPEQITAILVTHEHSDHVKGVAGFSNKYSIPVWLSKGTSLHKNCEKIKALNILGNHQSFSIGEINIKPVVVPHDAREATQFIFESNQLCVGILTDVGHITPYIQDAYKHCHALMLEANYDYNMLMQGRYPQALKQRVSGGLGHLSNHQALEFLQELDYGKLKTLAIMHRSEENNSEELVKEFILANNEVTPESSLIANQAVGFDWQEVKSFNSL